MVQDSEMKKDVKYSLAIDEDSSDDEEEKPKEDANRIIIDLDEEKKKIEVENIEQSYEEIILKSKINSYYKGNSYLNNSFDTEIMSYEAPVHQPNLLVESERFQNTVLPTVIPEKISGSTDINPENTSKFHEISDKTLESLTDPDDDDGHSLWNYTLSDDMVTIPELGSFKRKKHFNGLVTAQLIEKMLSQSIPRDFPFNDSI